MKTNQPAAQSLPQRITISTRNPFSFLEEVGDAHAKGYWADTHGYLLLNVPNAAFMVEMTLPQESAND